MRSIFFFNFSFSISKNKVCCILSLGFINFKREKEFLQNILVIRVFKKLVYFSI